MKSIILTVFICSYILIVEGQTFVEVKNYGVGHDDECCTLGREAGDKLEANCENQHLPYECREKFESCCKSSVTQKHYKLGQEIFFAYRSCSNLVNGTNHMNYACHVCEAGYKQRSLSSHCREFKAEDYQVENDDNLAFIYYECCSQQREIKTGECEKPVCDKKGDCKQRCHFNVNGVKQVMQCQGEDLCLKPDVCGPGKKCESFNGQTRCVDIENPGKEPRGPCDKGYERNSLNTCEDIDECLKETACEPNEVCVNLKGTFECKKCDDGLRYDKKEKTCKDINECEEGNHKCDINSNCRNTHRNYTCDCKNGYNRNVYGQCQDINECLEKSSPCKDGRAKCDNTVGGFKCLCPGDTLKEHSDNCDDIPTCIESECINGQCVKSGRGRKCSCGSTLRFDDNKKMCVDIDECKTNNPCPTSKACLNTFGSYYCFDPIKCQNDNYERKYPKGPQYPFKVSCELKRSYDSREKSVIKEPTYVDYDYKVINNLQNETGVHLFTITKLRPNLPKLDIFVDGVESDLFGFEDITTIRSKLVNKKPIVGKKDIMIELRSAKGDSNSVSRIITELYKLNVFVSQFPVIKGAFED